MNENTENQLVAFKKGRSPVKVVFHYSDGSTMEYLFQHPGASINVLANLIQQITAFIK